MSKSRKSRGRGGLRRHIKMHMARQAHGRSHYKPKQKPGGAFADRPRGLRGASANLEMERLAWGQSKEAASEYTGPEKPITEQTANLHELRASVAWFSSSGFMVTLLKEIICNLYRRHGADGILFLSDLGLRSLDDLRLLDDMSGVAICDLLESAIEMMTDTDRRRLGLAA